MADKKAFSLTGVQILRIDILSAEIENKTDNLSIKGKEFTHKLTYRFESGINVQKNRVRVKTEFNINTLDKEQNVIDIFANFTFSFIFEVPNLIDIVGDSNDPDVPIQMMVSLSSLAYSTARGIVFAKTQGSILENNIIPVLMNKEIEETIRSS